MEEKTIETVGGTFQIFSPDYDLDGGTYPNNILCQYNLACPANYSNAHFVMLEWDNGQFVLENIKHHIFSLVCEDYVTLHGFPEDNLEDLLDNINHGICGNQQHFSDYNSNSENDFLGVRYSLQIIDLFWYLVTQAEFRSDRSCTQKGFILTVVCTNATGGGSGTTGTGEPPVCTKLDAPSDDSMAKDHPSEFASPKPLPQMGEDRVKVPRAASSPRLPLFRHPKPLPLTGAGQIQIPHDAFLTYKHGTLRVIQDGYILRTFKNIAKLIFGTGFNGTREFDNSAFVPKNEIFGGGEFRTVELAS